MPLPQKLLSPRPDRILMRTPDPTPLDITEGLAQLAADRAKVLLPKISGALAGSISPIFGTTFWGLYFPDRRAWFLEQGTNPFTMRSLAGKTIPMWVDDPDGSTAKEIGPKAQTRITLDGRRQTKIFRRAAKMGQKKWVIRRGRRVQVPASYPGAPGRISSRMNNGQIGEGNVGVRWRHPGIGGRQYLNQAMEYAALQYGIDPDELLLVDSATYSVATRS